jgi:putative flippase GtrA
MVRRAVRNAAMGNATDDPRHLVGFVIAGCLAVAMDIWVGLLLAHGLGLPWPIARIGAIAASMAVAFYGHRTLTFRRTTPATMAEFLRYLGVAWTSALVNYATFIALLWLVPALPPSLGIVASAGVSMIVTYVGLRFAVFSRS